MIRASNAIALIAIFISIFVIARSNHRQNELAKEGAETHAALCVFKADIQQRVDDSQQFLDMTLEQRVEKYGQALGSIQSSVIRTTLVNQQRTLSSLSSLDCS